MVKNIVNNKDYKYLRENIFSNLEMSEFMEVYTRFKRLKLQYRFLQIAKYLERINIPNIEMPIFRFFCKINKLYTLENL